MILRRAIQWPTPSGVAQLQRQRLGKFQVVRSAQVKLRTGGPFRDQPEYGPRHAAAAQKRLDSLANVQAHRCETIQPLRPRVQRHVLNRDKNLLYFRTSRLPGLASAQPFMRLHAKPLQANDHLKTVSGTTILAARDPLVATHY